MGVSGQGLIARHRLHLPRFAGQFLPVGLAVGRLIFGPVDNLLPVALMDGKRAFVVAPSLPQLQLAHGLVQLVVVAVWIDGFVCLGIDPIDHKMPVRVIRVPMHGC